jgi:hypothetical protein
VPVKDGPKERQREAERRRRLAAAFGESMPEQTRDESGEAWGERPAKDDEHDDEWLGRQVPPHHGG